METKDKCKKSIQEKDIAILKSDFTLPLPKLDQEASIKPPLKGFTRAMSNLVEEDSLPIRRTEEGFDPKAYKLLAKSGYDFKNPPQLGQLYSDYVEEKSHGLNSTQSKLKQQGYAIEIPRTGLGYSSQEPVRISAKGKGKKVTSQHITFEVEEEGKPKPVSRSSVFDRLGTSTPRESVFNRLSISLPTKEGTSRTRRSAFDRLGSTSSSTDTPRPKEGKSGLQKRNGTEACSLIPSRMKRELIIEVNTGDSLKVKQRTIVHTRELEKQVDDRKEDHETLVLPFCHVTAETDSESDASDDEPNEAPRAIEDGGQATVDELKELNLRTDEEPHPIYVSFAFDTGGRKKIL